MEQNRVEITQDLADMLSQNPKLLVQLARKGELADFKETFKVERASPLRCPACSQYGQSGGSLWRVIDEKNEFVCRKCNRRFRVEWMDGEIDDLILKIKEANK